MNTTPHKLSVAVIFGGTNTEHEVSLVSTKGIIANLDPQKYTAVPIKIGKDNLWSYAPELRADYTPARATPLASPTRSLASIHALMTQYAVDLVFPVLHGPYGEDGTIQGLLEMLRIPYVGCGVAASAVCMDKVIQKNLCQAYQIPVPRSFWFTQEHWQAHRKETLDHIHDALEHHFPSFVKPANQGSSIGITKAHDEEELVQGIELALTRDTKILVEQGVEPAREIECSVLGPSYAPETSVLGEIIPGHEFYDYEDKYLDEGSRAVVPAPLSAELVSRIQATARLAYEVLGCDGLARVDFLLEKGTENYYLSEVNTMPGFTPISMYPKLWEASGISYPELLDRLITLALERHAARESLNFSR